MSAEVLPYTDPLLELLKDPNLNKEKEKVQQLVEYIDEIEDSKLKSWCIEAFEILRDLEKIEVKINNWEFQTLDFNISVDSIMANEQDLKRRKFNLELAKRVSKHCLELHRLLSELSLEIDELSTYSKRLTALQKISDPGTILTELNLRVIRLQDLLTDEISIHYSRARLVNIGISLEDLVNKGEDGSDDNSGGINNETVRNYKEFVNNLLQQLNGCVASNDTIGAMECIAIVNDVEKMFVTMKAQKQEEKQRKILDDEQKSSRKESKVQNNNIVPNTEGEDYDAVSPSSSSNLTTLCGDEEEIKQKAVNPESFLESLPEESKNNNEIDEDNLSIDSDEAENKADSSLLSVKVDERRKRRHNNDQVTMNLEDSILHRTTISEKLPFLMSAFEEAKAAESGLIHAVSNQYGGDEPPAKRQMPDSPKKRQSPTLLRKVNITSTPQKGGSEETIEEEEDEEEDENWEDAEAGQELEPTASIPAYLPLFSKPSILSAFFQPKIKEPIYMSSSQQEAPYQSAAAAAAEAAKKKRYMRKLTGSAVQEKLLKFQQDEELRDLNLSTRKLTSIEVGAGRVKETVKEIEQQLPTRAIPPTPVKGSPKDSPKSSPEAAIINSEKSLDNPSGATSGSVFIGPPVPPSFQLFETGPKYNKEQDYGDTSSIEDSVD
ncbi:DEKNAAC105039 [Brettanomyces naardenensis]|uniref:DEKNAAC105039 n=1 Tax=Brettanomyces naardenensis TaxID=13370 RepID=A0A448YS30_BRENA|nr:DEKNAAC105039 [Brettanomyces naardenensis]